MRKYFGELLNDSGDLINTSNIPEAPQVIKATKSMKNNKSPSSDEAITVEALKYGCNS